MTLHVLCVDDEVDNLRVLRYTLKYCGISSRSAQSGDEALHLLNAERFDLILLDLQMPTISGWNVIRWIRANESQSIRNLPVVAVTAHAMVGDRERVLAAGFDGYVSKPIDPPTFLQTLRSQEIRGVSFEVHNEH
jgi:CheY-like chemotaxis protein